MPTYGPNIAGVGTDGGGAATWTNPGNISATDGVFAVNTFSTPNELRASSFGFAIPTNEAIVGVTLTIRLKVNSSVADPFHTFSLFDGTTALGTDKTSSQGYSTTLTDYIYGSSSDLWGATLTAAILNGSAFQAHCLFTENIGGKTWSVDSISMTAETTGLPTGVVLVQNKSRFPKPRLRV